MCYNIIKYIFEPQKKIKSFEIDLDRNLEEAIYYTLRAQNFHLHLDFPENRQYYGNFLIYQLSVRKNQENWTSNLCAQTHLQQKKSPPLLFLSPQNVYNPTKAHDPKNPNNLLTLTAHAHRKYTVRVYNNSNNTSNITNNRFSNQTQYQQQHNTAQYRIKPRNNDSTLVNNHFDPNYRQQQRHSTYNHNKTLGASDRAA